MLINEFVTQEELEDLDEKASRALCLSATPNSKLGASNLSSCKAQGLRAREGAKTRNLTGKKWGKRSKVAGKKVKSVDYGGPIKNYVK
jgi:hypothetical protein